MTWGDGVGAAALVVRVIVAVIYGRSALAAQRLKGEQEEKMSEGKLALDVAREARASAQETGKRVDLLESWREDVVYTWWPQHENRDRAIEHELLKLDPAAVIPPSTPLPRLRPQSAT